MSASECAGPIETEMNDLTKKEAPDRSKINLHDPLQAKAWSHELGVIIERLIELVEKVGNSAAGVRPV